MILAVLIIGSLTGFVSLSSYSSMANSGSDRLKYCEKKLDTHVFSKHLTYEKNLYYLNAMQALHACMEIEKEAGQFYGY